MHQNIRYLFWYLILKENSLLQTTYLIQGTHYFPFIFGGSLICQCSGLCLFLFPFNSASCVFLNFLIGIGPTMVFSAIFVKTHLIHSIFIKRMENPGSSEVNMQICPSFIEKLFKDRMDLRARQILHVVFICFIQVVIIFSWSAYMSGQFDIFPSNRHIRVCVADLTNYFTLHIFNIFLIFCCTLYGYLVRNVPR